MVMQKPDRIGRDCESGSPTRRLKIMKGMKLCAFALMPVGLFALSACGGGGSGSTTTPPPATYTIGGTVSGLSGSGLVLQDNGGNNLPVGANGAFTFSTPVAGGGAYDVTVLTQPSNPAESCIVKNGSGAATANIASVQITCAPTTYTIGGTVSGLSGKGLVLQDNGGDNLPLSADGAFTFVTAIASGSTYNVTVLTQPSGPSQTCVVNSGGGMANANVATVEVACNDTNTPEWTWVNGNNLEDQKGTYGTKGMAAPGNVPGGRDTAVSWTDRAGNFWLFGGNGLDSAGTRTNGALNDLWMYGTGTGEWTWIGGSNLANQPGIYGTRGTPAPGNFPGARSGAASWTDAAGDFWLFGGHGYDSSGTAGLLNDLWKYSAGQWTWMSGSNVAAQVGTYGTKGTPAPGNVPGARNGAASWVDAAGDFWLFDGHGYDSAGVPGLLNDLWKYSTSAAEWTWIGGSNVFGSPGTYGTQGMAAPSNIPGARNGAAFWSDAASNFWLFGGTGLDSTGTGFALNDLWKYSTIAGEWTWVDGSNLAGQSGTYGTLGTPAPANVPGARNGAALWTDAAGNLWLLGGVGFDSGGAGGELNDLWEFSAGEWSWIGGSNLEGQLGTYGTKGTPAPTNVPGSRNGSAVWTDAAGNIWLFGGFGHDATHSASGELNDLWQYSP
jgi:N-acetylneuraminic acid mutarotase